MWRLSNGNENKSRHRAKIEVCLQLHSFAADQKKKRTWEKHVFIFHSPFYIYLARWETSLSFRKIETCSFHVLFFFCSDKEKCNCTHIFICLKRVLLRPINCFDNNQCDDERTGKKMNKSIRRMVNNKSWRHRRIIHHVSKTFFIVMAWYTKEMKLFRFRSVNSRQRW